MPDCSAHETQYIHNKDFLSNCIRANPLYNDWIVTVCFYAALHLTDARFATKEKHFRSHKLRDEEMSSCLQLFGNEFYKNYTKLQSLSRKARYEAITISDVEAQSAMNYVENIKLQYDRLVSEEQP